MYTHVEKVMFPEAGVTKQDLLDYYQAIAPLLLPHLKDRPITLERLPEGLSSPRAPHFWQKNTPAHYPDWIPRVDLRTAEGKMVHYVLVNDERTLLYLVNQGTVTFHVNFSRTNKLDRPDFVLFDLDPEQGHFGSMIEIARLIHRRLDAAGIASFPKTSGKRGLHIFAPWRRRGGYDEARAWAMEIATVVAGELPDIATTERLKRDRGSRVYIDVIQNALGHHAVPPYVVRPTPLGSVSMPLRWQEVSFRLDPRRFTMKYVLKAMKGKGDPMKPLVESGRS